MIIRSLLFLNLIIDRYEQKNIDFKCRQENPVRDWISVENLCPVRDWISVENQIFSKIACC